MSRISICPETTKKKDPRETEAATAGDVNEQLGPRTCESVQTPPPHRAHAANTSPTLPCFRQPNIVPRDTLCLCEAYGMRGKTTFWTKAGLTVQALEVCGAAYRAVAHRVGHFG